MKPPAFKAVIFDLDGTLTVPTLDFARMRAELGIPTGDIADEIPKRYPDDPARAWAIVERMEDEAIERQVLQAGVLELLHTCTARGVWIGIVTRNTRKTVAHFLKRFRLAVDGVATRDDPPLKPHPAPVLRLLKQWEVAPAAALVVGDYRHDIESGRSAGTRTCFFQNPGVPFSGEGADHVVRSMQEVSAIIFPE